MKLRILFFSVLKDLTGTGVLELELESGRDWTVRDVLDRLYQRYEGLQAWDGALLVAADQEYVNRDTPLKSGQEIAMMPPVQGG